MQTHAQVFQHLKSAPEMLLCLEIIDKQRVTLLHVANAWESQADNHQTDGMAAGALRCHTGLVSKTPNQCSLAVCCHLGGIILGQPERGIAKMCMARMRHRHCALLALCQHKHEA